MLKSLGVVIGLGAAAVYFWPAIFNFERPDQLEEVHQNISPTVERFIETAQPYISDVAEVLEEQVASANVSQTAGHSVTQAESSIAEVAQQVEQQIENITYESAQLYPFWHPFSSEISALEFASNVGDHIGRNVLVERHGSEYVLYIKYMSENELNDIKHSLINVLGEGVI